MGWLPFVDDDDVWMPHYDPNLWEDIDWNSEFDAGYKKLAFMLSGLPVVGDIGYMADKFRSFEDYMRNYNLTWNDIVYPWMAGRSAGVSSAGFGVLNYMSRNLEKFYR